MPQDAFTLKFLCEELNEIFSGGKINRITQPSNDELVFTVYTGKTTKKLLLDVNPSAPRISVIEKENPSPLTAPNFCMLMRKHLLNATIDSISLVGFDRIVKIDLTFTGEFSSPIKKVLYIELMGRYSNIILTQDDKILGGNRGINMFDDGVRPLIVGKVYKFPPNNDKKPPNDDSLIEYFDGFDDTFNKLPDYLIKGVQGIALSTAKEIVCAYVEVKGDGKKENFGKDFFVFLNDFIENTQKRPCVVLSDNKVLDVCIRHYKETDYGANAILKYFDSLTDAEEFYFDKKISDKLFTSKKERLISIINTAIKKAKKRLTAIKSKENDAKDGELNKIKGELLLANIYNLKDGQSSCILDNFYNGEKIEIELDEFKSISQNAQAYFKKYNKQKRTIEMLKPQREQAESELTYLESIFNLISIATDVEEVHIIANEMTEYGLIKDNSPKGKKQEKVVPFRNYDIFGVNVKVGRNNIENDKLLGVAKGEDIWLHAKDYHSSFVLIENNGKEVEDKVLIKSAEICAYYSGGREAGKVEIVYTKRRNVKKPPKSKPGYVIYEKFKSVMVNAQKHSEFIKSDK